MELNYRKNNNKELFETINKEEYLDLENTQNYIPLLFLMNQNCQYNHPYNI